MTLNRYKYLLFDLDDTLLNFQQAQELAFKKLLEDENIEYSYGVVLKRENWRTRK